MPLELSEILDAAGSDRIRQLTAELPSVFINERTYAEFQKQASKERIIEIADKMGGLVLEYHYGWHSHNEKFFFAVESIEAFEAMIAVFEVMDH